MTTFATPEPITAVIDVVSGVVRVSAEDRDDTVVDVRPRDAARSSDVRAADRAKVEFVNGTLTVAAGPKMVALRGGAVEIDIALPARSGVKVSSAFADFHVTGVLSDSRFASASGDVRLDEVVGDVKVDTSSGDVQVRSVRGEVRVSTASGDVGIGAIAGDMTVNAASGDLTIGALDGDVRANLASGSTTVTTAVAGSLTVMTGSGDISLGIAERTAARLDVSTRTGALINTLTSVSGPDGDDRTLVVHARTRSGDISIRRAPEKADAVAPIGR